MINFKKITLIIFTITFIFITCKQPAEKKSIVTSNKETLKTVLDKNERELMELQKRRNEEEDSIEGATREKVLNDALAIAKQYKTRDTFTKEYTVAIAPDSLYKVDVEISSSFYFTKMHPHLIIRRYAPGNLYIDIFSKTNGHYKKVLSHQQWHMEYMNDTMQDINGDHRKDFVVNWYGVNGCCERAFSDVYLLRADQTSFSKKFEFINPTFSPAKKIIRGMEYGHAGHTELYKYKWHGEAVDTLEYVYYEENKKGEKTGKVIVSTGVRYTDNAKILKRLNSVPAEYRKLDVYDYFKGE